MMEIDIGGDLDVNALAFGFFGGSVGGDMHIVAPYGCLIGVGALLNVSGNSDIESIYGPVGYLFGSVGGDLTINAGELVSVGDIDYLLGLEIEYGGQTYDVTDLPVPVPVDNNDFIVGGNLDITTPNIINVEGDVAGIITADGNNVEIITLNNANINQIIADNLTEITSINGSILDSRPTEDANIITRDVNLNASNGSIGTLADDLNIDLLASTINLSAGGDINFTEPNGNIIVGLVESTSGTVKLTALNGSIYDGNNNALNIDAVNTELNAQNIIGYLNLNIDNSTDIATSGNSYISGTTGNLNANTGGWLYYTDINSGNVNITTGEEIRLYNGTISGNAVLTSFAPAYDGAAEINLGFTNTDLAIGGNLTATATNGNIYYYGGTVGGNATFNAAESYDHRYSLALGRLRDLDITGNLDATTAGHFVYLKGSVGGDGNIDAGLLAGIMDIDFGGDLDVDAMAFGYFGGNVSGDLTANAPYGCLLGAGSLLTVNGTVDIAALSGLAGFYLGDVYGDLNVEADSLVNIGNIDELSLLTFDYDGTTYDINDIPYPIPVDNNDFSVSNDVNIITNGLVNYEGYINGIINIAGSDVELFTLGDATLGVIDSINDVDIYSIGSILDALLFSQC